MWILTETVRSGLMLAFAIFVIIILKKIASYFKKDAIETNEISDLHCWTDLDILLKTYTCNVCDAFLTGNYGKQCDNCGICCHDTCIKLAERNQRCKDVYILDEEQYKKHHWVKDGSLYFDYTEDVNIVCFVCGEECYETETSVSQCCWCQRIKHTQCTLSTISDVCDFGRFRQFIIPPFCVTPTKSNKRKFKIKSLSHPGWDDWTPVIILANRRAGNSDGALILSYFRRLLNPFQVIDLRIYSPSILVKLYSVIPVGVQLIILVAGGDGTVSWILNTINKSFMKLPMTPPVGIIPLGTGNDLSRVLSWGKEYSRSNGISSYFNKLSHCDIVDLDRWTVTIKTSKNIRILKPSIFYFYNYFSIGVDAKVAFDFHQTRQSSSLYMSSRFYNKLLYTFFGTRQVVIPHCNGLQNRLELYLDGVKISSIPEIESVVIVNIPSWAAGVKLWKYDADHSMSPQKIDDGKLEIVGIYSSFHIAQLQIGLSEPYCIGQASEIKILLLDSLPVQIDGEPWIQQPAEITISLCNKAKVLKVT